MIVDIAKQCGPRLMGKLPGKRDFGRMCELLSSAKPGTVVFLDFANVEVVTGSWINAMLIPLLDWAADERNELYPIILNVKEKWLDEFVLVASWTHRCFLACDGKIPPKKALLLGTLDPGQSATLEAILQLRAATGAELERRISDEKIRATAWNNRLKDLHAKRLLKREKRGREQVYEPVIQEIEHHGR